MTKIITCTCNQCRAKKRKMRGNYKKRAKRRLNRIRRRGGEGKVVNWCWA